MKDLTQGSVTRNILEMAGPIAAGMVFQTLYLLVDLYFVAGLGDAAVAGVGAAGTIMFIVMALTQVLGVGAVALIAQAVGRKDRDAANLVFNQSIVLAFFCALATLLAGYTIATSYVASITADAAARNEGITFLSFFLPGLALQFALITMGSALRGTGIVKPGMIVQVLTVLLNTVLAPILIAGWLTGRPFGVAGGGLASSISVAAGVAMLWFYFVKLERYVAFDSSLWRPKLHVWRRMLDVGLPAGGEFGLMFVYMAVVYLVIGEFGAASQAGFSIGGRVMQSIFLPAMAIAFAAGPIAGQNFGAGHSDRVRETLSKALLLNAGVMISVTLLLQWRPEVLITVFTRETEVVAVGAGFLRIISWNFLAQGIVFTCSGIFQGLGNTRPALLSSFTRIAIFTPMALLLARRPGFELEQVWYLSVATVLLQAALSYSLLQRQFRLRLGALDQPGRALAMGDSPAPAAAPAPATVTVQAPIDD
jgi:putative MATE family efflux protein